MSDSIVHAVAGAGGGVLSMALTYPLIIVSTRSQVNSKNGESSSQLSIAKKILKEEGVKGFYSGLKSALFGISITQAIYYYWYELVKHGYQVNLAADQALSIVELMTTGAIAGSITSILTNPIWTRLLVKETPKEKSDSALKGAQPPTKKGGMWAAALQVYKEDGFSGFWRGIFPALILVSNPIIQYTVFEKLKQWVEKNITKELTAFHFFLLGAASKLVATGITYPYITIKSRMHVSSGDASQKTPSIYESYKTILKNEGYQGLYKGIQSKIMQSVLTSALLFALKEELFNSSLALLVALKLREK